MKEILRRMILLASVVLSLCMARWAPMDPAVEFEAVDMAEAFAQGDSFHILDHDTMAMLKSQGPDAYEKRLTKGRLYQAKGPQWEEFFAMAERYFDNPDSVPDWDNRWGKYGHGRAFWFKADEQPAQEIAAMAREAAPVLFMSLGQGKDAKWLEANYAKPEPEDFRPFNGYSGPHMPLHFIYPYLYYSWIPALIGLLVYVFMAWPKRTGDHVYYPRWTLILTDLSLTILIFLPFFGLALVLGGPVQTFTSWWGIPLVLWPMAMLGVWGMKHAAYYTVFSLLLKPKAIEVTNLEGDDTIQLSRVKSITRVEMKPPKWLTAMLWIGSMAGSGADSARMAGQAMLMGSAVYRGLIFNLRDGRRFTLWFTNQTGRPMMRGLEALEPLVDKSGIPLDDEIRKITGMAPMSGFGKEAGSGAVGRPMLKLTASVLGTFLICAVIALLTMASHPVTPGADSVAKQAGSDRSVTDAKPDNTVKAPEKTVPRNNKPAPEILWSASVNDGTTHAFANSLAVGVDGSILVLGTHDDPVQDTYDIFVAKLSAQKILAWSRSFIGNYLIEVMGKPADYGLEYANGIVALDDGGCAVLYETRLKNRSSTGTILLGLDDQGDEIWRYSKDQKGAHDEPVALFKRGGNISILVDSKKSMFPEPGIETGMRLVTLGENGKVLDEKVPPLNLKNTGIASVVSTDQGLVLAGTQDHKGPGHLDMLLMAVDSQGGELWSNTYGGSGAEQATHVLSLGEGFLLSGYSGIKSEGTQDPYIVRVDSQGQPLWDNTLQVPGNQHAIKSLALDDGRIVVLCMEFDSNGYRHRGLLWVVDSQGRTIKDLWLQPRQYAQDMVLNTNGELLLVTDNLGEQKEYEFIAASRTVVMGIDVNQPQE